MANSLVKGLALTLGGGIAVGLGIKIGQTSVPSRRPEESIDFTPVLDRIEGVESRIITVESQQAAMAALAEAQPMVIPSVQELEDQVKSQASVVEQLRAAIQEAVTKHDARIDDLGYAVSNLESKIPELIDESIKPRFEELHDRVQREMQETASQTLEVFADRIQARVVEKISSIEGDLNRQSEAINHLRDYSLKTDQSLERLLSGVESLADKINRKFETPAEPQRLVPPQRAETPSATQQVPPAGGLTAAPPVTPTPKPPPAPHPPEPKASAQASPAPFQIPTPAPMPAPAIASAPIPTPVVAGKEIPLPAPAAPRPSFPARIELGATADIRPARDSQAPRGFTGPDFEDLLAEPPRSNGLRRAAFAGGGLILVGLAVGGVELSGALGRSTSAHSSPQSKVATVIPAVDALDTNKLTDQSEMLDQARAFTQKREFSKAEDLYRAILKSDPSNTEVKRLLASALFRQEKIDESVKVLNSISEEKQQATHANPETQQ